MSGAMWSLRDALPRDVATIMSLEKMTPELAHWSEVQYAAMLSTGEGALARRFLVAEVDGGVKGFIAGRHLEGELTAEIETLVVSSDMRRAGMATALLIVFTEWAWNTCGAEGLSLEVRASNAGARNFYERRGFWPAGIRENYYREPAEDAVVLLKAFWEKPESVAL